MNADDFTVAPDLDFPSAPRIAVGLLWQETNCFNPLNTLASDFIVQQSEAVIPAHEAAANSLGGIVRKLRSLNALPVPVLAAKARPGGRIVDAVIEDLMERLIEGIVRAKPDGVCLELHGSMVAESVDDVEGRLLSRLREAVGSAMPISVALDLHGHMTAEMAQNADFLTAYRTNPHRDMVETGERAAAVLAAMMTRGLKPVASRRSLPFIALADDETTDAPMRGVRAAFEKLPARSDRSFLDLSIFNVHPHLDLNGMGQVVLAYADGDASVAASVAEAVSGRLWNARKEFVGKLPEIDEIFEGIAESAARGGRPCAIGDQGDSVLGGTPGDSVEIARYGAMHHPALRGLIPVFDPVAVELAVNKGVGATADFALGASASTELKPLGVTATVEKLTDRTFLNEGAYMTGLVNDLGLCAVLRSGAQVFVATTRAPSACDPALAAHAGYELADFDYVVVKSGSHFRMSFEAQCHCVTAPTPGLSTRNPAHLTHSRGRPLYPFDDIEIVMD